MANMYCNRFSIILYIISDNSLRNPDEEWYDHEILVCKNITESFTSFVLCFLNVLFITQATLVMKKNIKFFRSVVNSPDNYQRYCAQFPL